MNTKTIIGLEIHAQLSTDSKMFCSCKNEFGAVPNTHVCPTCLGHPGTFPLINKKAVRYAIMAGIALDCNIRTDMKMDRKKYFYPDLTKGYQISQEEEPLCFDGHIMIKDKDDSDKKVRIRRIHMEEDTCKSTHNQDGSTLLDYNRAGVPLIEIVSEPDMETPEEARQFLDNLKQRLKFIGVSNVKMEEGSLRCDVNINVHDLDSGRKTGIAEIKNLNSFKAVVKALEYEEKEHIKLLENDIKSTKVTKKWDDINEKTIKMRDKDLENDYRFTVEGDIPRIRLSREAIEELKERLPELPHEKEKRYVEDLNLDIKDARILSQNKALSDLFENLSERLNNPVLASNWILSNLLRRLNEHEQEADEMNLSLDNLVSLIKLKEDGKINNNVAKKILRRIYESNEDPIEIVKEEGLIQIQDDNKLEKIVDEVLEENPQTIEDYHNGKDRVVGFLVGQSMKKSKGQGNPQVFNEMIVNKLKSSK